MLFKKLTKQYRTPWIGAFKETLGQALWWGVPLNSAMIAGTFYYTTVRHVAPWVDPVLFFVCLALGVIVVYVLEFKFILPSTWSFREKQMFSHKSEVMDKLIELEKLIKGEKEEKKK